jgi:hypothetical protein
MQESKRKEINSRVGKTLFLLVMFMLVLMIANRIHPGSTELVGALLGFAGFTAVFGRILAALLDQLFLTQLLGPRNGLVASCLVIWLLALAYLLTLPSDGTIEHSPTLRVIGATIGMYFVFWLRRRRQDRSALIP